MSNQKEPKQESQPEPNHFLRLQSSPKQIQFEEFCPIIPFARSHFWKGNYRRRTLGRGRGNFNPNFQPMPEVCFNCGLLGHLASNCHKPRGKFRGGFGGQQIASQRLVNTCRGLEPVF